MASWKLLEKIITVASRAEAGLSPYRVDKINRKSLLEPRTLFQKIWDSHIVTEEPGCPSVLYIDLHLVHEVTSPQAFQGLREKGLRVRRPGQTLATMDHSIPTTDPDGA